MDKWALGSMIISSIILIFFSPEISESFKDVKVMIKQIIPVLMIFILLMIRKNKNNIFFFLVTVFFEIGYALLNNLDKIYNALYNNMPFRLEGYRLDGYRANFMEFSMKIQLFLVCIYIMLLSLKIISGSILSGALSLGLIALFFNNTRMAWLIISFMFIVLTSCKIQNMKKINHSIWFDYGFI